VRVDLGGGGGLFLFRSRVYPLRRSWGDDRLLVARVYLVHVCNGQEKKEGKSEPDFKNKGDGRWEMGGRGREGNGGRQNKQRQRMYGTGEKVNAIGRNRIL
jgi:hypothetical protein